MTSPSENHGIVVSVVGPRPKDTRFWLIIFAVCMALFLSALELTAVSTALPTIVADLQGEHFVWVGSAYALASSAILPMTGGLAQIFGRKPSFLGGIGFFAIGSVICGAAKNMTMLIAGRTVQGLGGGGILSLSVIVIGDMVTLEERGLYAGGCFGV
jgi:MFS family permease